MKRPKKPTPILVALAKITTPGAGYKASAVASAEAILREHANVRRLSLGEHRLDILRSVTP